MKNIFADKATLILRKMLTDPGKKWVVSDNGVSFGLAQEKGTGEKNNKELSAVKEFKKGLLQKMFV